MTADQTDLESRRTTDLAGDRALVRAVLQGRAPARRELGNRLRCVSRMLATQSARLGRPLDEHEIADLGQDTTILILCKLPDYGGQVPLEAWIHSFCRLELHNAIRRKRRLPRTGVAEPEDAIATPADHLANRELVRVALDALDPHEAEVIRSKHLDGLTFEEMARAMRVASGTLKTLYYRGLARLELRLRHASPWA